jgi:hypothetical protein
VDSSKSAYRFRAIHDREPDKTLAVVLARDYRAVVHSKMKRGVSLKAAATGWRKKMIQLEALTHDLPTGHVHRLTYESLCEDTRTELSRLCEFVGIGFEEAMLQRPTREIHHLGGSPSKFDMSRTSIVMDSEYESQFSKAELDLMRGIVGGVGERWGY